MAMQTDVKSKYLSASGAITAARGRIKAISICPTAATAGSLVLKDGGSSGTSVLQIDIPVASTGMYQLLPGEGILCESSIYATLTTVASVTVYYG